MTVNTEEKQQVQPISPAINTAGLLARHREVPPFAHAKANSQNTRRFAHLRQCFAGDNQIDQDGLLDCRVNSYCKIKLGLLCLLGSILALLAQPTRAEVCARDDLDKRVCLEAPAERIAALSPGATELVYAAGAGDRVVAVVSFSDYPPEAKQVQSVGSHTRLDLEKLVTLEPDLVIGWVTGNPPEQLESIAAIGIPVFYIEPHSFADIASALRRLALLAGTESVGDKVAGEFEQGMSELAHRYTAAEPVSVFYQVWDEPLMTVNDHHFIGQVITLCGGRNIFADLGRDVPRIDLESVLVADPEAIVAGGMGEENREWLDFWEEFPGLTAVKRDNLFFVPPSLIQRPSPRLLEGSRMLCEKLEQARERR